MNIITTEGFQRSFAKLPKNIQRLYRTQEKRFAKDWQDPRLHIKKLRDIANVFSFRVTRSYRVLFYFQNSTTAVFFEIDHRKDIYRK